VTALVSASGAHYLIAAARSLIVCNSRVVAGAPTACLSEIRDGSTESPASRMVLAQQSDLGWHSPAAYATLGP
jgi:hypothetical protein